VSDSDGAPETRDQAETAETSEGSETPSTRAPRRRFPRRFPVKSVVALAIIVLLGLPVVSLLQPGYYSRYPELTERMENWRTSTHARMSCADCHVEPGIDGYLSFAAKAVPAFYSQVVGGPDASNLLHVPTIAACQKCHTSYREVSSGGDLLIPHQAHVEVLEMECAFCHQDLVHTANPQGRNTPKMTFCLEECHDGTAASAECVDCHTRKEVPDNHLRDDWLLIHAEMIATEDCGECHAWSPDYCAECHAERPPSHTGNWKKLHQVPALERGSEGCKACHDDAFCQECHD